MISLVNDLLSLPIVSFGATNLRERFMNNPFYRCLLFSEDDHFVAFLSFLYIYDRLEIEDFMVLDEYRNKGIGSILMEYFLQYSVNNSVKNITLEVRSDNYIAIKLYKKYGFVEKAIRKNYYSNVDGILMEKEMI